MRTFKSAVVLVSVLLLGACGGTGETKITKVDGTSNASATRSLEKMIYGMPDGEVIQWQNDLSMLKSRYPEGADFSKKVGGKTLEELKPGIAEAKAYFIKVNRENRVAEVQVDIDELQAKLEGFEASPESNIKSIMISQTKSKMASRTQARDEILALSDDQIFATYGCACEEGKFQGGAKY